MEANSKTRRLSGRQLMIMFIVKLGPGAPRGAALLKPKP